MAEMVIPVTRLNQHSLNGESRLHIAVHIQTDVLDPEVARRKANQWLFLNAGNLVRAEHPQLILDVQLLWRFDVCLTLPNLQNPGTGKIDVIGRLQLDAVTGEAIISSTFIQELQDSANAVTLN